MEILSGLILGLPSVAQVMLMLCLVAVLGLGLGDLHIRGISLGIGGVLFAGIAVGHAAKLAGITLDAAMLDFVREFGLILFVYSIGIQVGPGFFSALKRSGLALNLLATGLVVMSVLTAVAIHLGAGLPLPVVLGLFSGAVTNTPSLGAAQQVLKEVRGLNRGSGIAQPWLRDGLSLRHRRHSADHAGIAGGVQPRPGGGGKLLRGAPPGGKPRRSRR
jgi:putative transport protein